MIRQESVRVIANNPVESRYYRLRFACGDHYARAVPGQFVTVRLPGQTQPLLRRPFSIHRLLAGDDGRLHMEILYRVVGDFTRQLARQAPGNRLDLLGPVGHGFTVAPHAHPVAVVAGGIGVAPLVFLCQRLKQAGMDMKVVTVFMGGRTKSDILCEDIFSGLGTDVRLATEDGSAGVKGLVTRSLHQWLESGNAGMVYACGPLEMLRAVGKMARERGIACEVSMETVMACGLGACMGCAIPTRDVTDRYRHACKDGPVFDAGVLI